MANLEHPPEAKLPGDISHGLRIAAIVLRTLFIVLLLVLTLRVSLPQNETIWTAYDTPADLVRLLLGVGVCGWLAYQLFQVPKDAGSSRTWFLSRPCCGAFHPDHAVRGMVTVHSVPSRGARAFLVAAFCYHRSDCGPPT
jgi:hypothetical protein